MGGGRRFFLCGYNEKQYRPRGVGIHYNFASGQIYRSQPGGVFFVDDINQPQAMHLMASYAYDRKKYQEKTIYQGEGLIGAAWKEKEYAVINQVPQGYISITSGLGHALPDKLIIYPIMTDKKVFGAMEIASFQSFDPQHIEIIGKVCHLLASNYEAIKIQEMTLHLLHTSQIQAEELKAQEEEMRQNLEEMAATQEDFSRRENEQNELVEYLQNYIKELEAQSRKKRIQSVS
ncbi:MAG: GAF domain-containing protein [Cyclobacteriaceae bacterium]|nr:GAF domain-containing protein [Cyclobacteriaceae bacterium]